MLPTVNVSGSLPSMKSTHVRISDELRKKVNEMSRETGRPAIHIVNAAVMEYLKKVRRG